MKQTETVFHQGAWIRLEGVVHSHMCTRPIGQPIKEQGEFHRAVVSRAGPTPLPRTVEVSLFDAPAREGEEIDIAVLGMTEEDAIACLVHRRDVTDHHMEEGELGLL